MKRKDWKIKNLKKGIFDKIKNNSFKGKVKKSISYLEKKRISFFLKRRLLLRKLFLRRNRLLLKKDLFINYFFFKKVLNFFKKKKINYNINIFLKTKINTKTILPEFSMDKNVFNKKNKTKHLFKHCNLNYLHFNNKIIRSSFGLNYYVILNNKDKILYQNFQKLFLEESNFNLISFKNNFELQSLHLKHELNILFNYNLYNLNVLEIYKILIILNFNLFL